MYINHLRNDPPVLQPILFRVLCPGFWISAIGLALTLQFSCPLPQFINYIVLVVVADPQLPYTMPDRQELIYTCLLQMGHGKFETELAKELENYISASIWKVQLYEVV